MIKHEVQKDQHGIWALQKDGMPTMCPYQPPIIIPNAIDTKGSFDMSRTPCCSMCPHFALKAEKEGLKVVLTCGRGTVLDIDNAETSPATPDSGIVTPTGEKAPDLKVEK